MLLNPGARGKTLHFEWPSRSIPFNPHTWGTVVELLQACGQRYAEEIFVEAPEHDGCEEGTVRVMLYLPDSCARIVLMAAKASGLSAGATAKAMLYKLWRDKPEVMLVPVQENALSEVLSALNSMNAATEVRPEQLAAFECMTDALKQKKIGMVEASTGESPRVSWRPVGLSQADTAA